MSNIFKYTLAAGLLVLASGCRKDIAEQPIPTPEPARLPASLTLTLNAADIYRAAIGAPETRNLTAPDDDTSEWTDEELLADGRTIRRLTVMLVDSISQEMVAYRHIIYNGADADPKPIHMPLLCSDDAPEGGNGFVGADGAVDVNLKHSDRVRLTFNYDNPLHGDIERLRHGTYVLIAVANYASLPKTENDDTLPQHPAVENENGFVQQIHMLIHKFYGDDDVTTDENLWNEEFIRKNGKGIARFRDWMSGFYDYVLEVALDKNGNQPYVRKKLDELPLFTAAYIDLQPGGNVLTEPIWLYRTYSRVRVEVKNYSTEPLSVNHLEFSDNFSKDRTYFCRMPGASNIFEGLDYKAGAPDVSYSESVIAFPYYNTSVEGKTFTEEEKENYKYYIIADTDTSRNEAGTAQPTIETGQTAAVFDAYISPSRDDEEKKYKYTIEVEYKGVSGYTSCRIDDNASAISAGDSFAGRYFMLKVYGTTSHDYWIYKAANGYVRTQNAEFSTLRQQIIDDKDYRFIWQIVRNGDKYYLRNPINGDYICKFEDTKSVGVYVNNGYSYINILTASNDISLAESFTVTTDKNNNTFLFLGSSNSQYMNHYGGSSTYMSYWTGTDGNSQFQLYPVEFMSGTPCLRKEIVLQTIDNETSAVSDVTEIRRNDFVRILVEVSYNPDNGNFEFEVQPWETGKGGDITFN